MFVYICSPVLHMAIGEGRKLTALPSALALFSLQWLSCGLTTCRRRHGSDRVSVNCGGFDGPVAM